MRISDMLLTEFDHEMANTRKTLERVPDDKFDWTPHQKSTTMGGLATHLANIPTWAVHALTKDPKDIAPAARRRSEPNLHAPAQRFSKDLIKRLQTPALLSMQRAMKSCFSLGRFSQAERLS